MSSPEVITVNSEELEATIRNLLPSQNGFGSELQASNVIMPVIDLTASAEGSSLPVDLSRALAFGSQTAFDVTSTTTTIADSPGFYRVFGTMTAENDSSTGVQMHFTLDDTSTTKIIYGMEIPTDSTKLSFSESYDFIVFLAAGESLDAVSNAGVGNLKGSVRQVATVTGTLVNPSGFVAE
jgi:hypothetical protein